MTTLILRVTTRLLVPPLVALGVYLLWRGHNDPGGGFIAALLIGVTVALRALTLPPGEPFRYPRASTLLGSGLLVATLTGVVPVLLGLPFMTGGYWEYSLPLLGDQKLTASFFFDIGVALIVVGLLRAIVDALGGITAPPDPKPVSAASDEGHAEPIGSDARDDGRGTVTP